MTARALVGLVAALVVAATRADAQPAGDVRAPLLIPGPDAPSLTQLRRALRDAARARCGSGCALSGVTALGRELARNVTLAAGPTALRVGAQPIGPALVLTLEGTRELRTPRWLGDVAVRLPVFPWARRVPLDAELRARVRPRPPLRRDDVRVERLALPAALCSPRGARSHLGPCVLALGTPPAASGSWPTGVLAATGEGLWDLAFGPRRMRVRQRVSRPRQPRGTTVARRPLVVVDPRPWSAPGVLPGPPARDPAVWMRARWQADAEPVVLSTRGERLTPGPDPCPPGTLPLVDACAEPVDARDYYASTLRTREGLDPPLAAPSSFLARAVLSLRRTHGRVDRVEAIVTPRGRLVVRTGVGSSAATHGIAGVGSALALGDVDGDGLAELLVSAGTPAGEGDRLRLLRVREDGALRRVWESDRLAGSVFVAGAVDGDGDGLPELLAVEERPGARARLWRIR